MIVWIVRIQNKAHVSMGVCWLSLVSIQMDRYQIFVSSMDCMSPTTRLLFDVKTLSLTRSRSKNRLGVLQEFHFLLPHYRISWIAQ